MTAHHHHHVHSHPGRPHPPAPPPASILRLSVWQRLAMAGALSALMWLAVLWAMR
jgi:hypothetical protein